MSDLLYKILFLLLPLSILAQSSELTDTLFTKNGRIYPCIITEVHDHYLKFNNNTKRSTHAAWNDLLKVVIDSVGTIYTDGSGLATNMDTLSNYLDKRSRDKYIHSEDPDASPGNRTLGIGIGAPIFLDRKSDLYYFSYRLVLSLNDNNQILSASFNHNFVPPIIAGETGSGTLISNADINLLYGRILSIRKTNQYNRILALSIGIGLIQESRNATESSRYIIGLPIELIWQSQKIPPALNTGVYAHANINKLDTYIALGFSFFLSY